MQIHHEEEMEMQKPVYTFVRKAIGRAARILYPDPLRRRQRKSG
jgi:hypothetical protein